MISVLSGPSCVGKTHLIENNRERLLEIVNFESDDEIKFFTTSEWDEMRVWTDVMWEEGIICCSTCGGPYRDRPQPNICIHFAIPNFGQPLIKKISEVKTPKSVIILGVPYSEYKVRIELRRERNPNRSRPPLLYNPDVPVNRYKDWINELNKNEIPYVFVEAIGDYKVLEEEEFFRMLND